MPLTASRSLNSRRRFAVAAVIADLPDEGKIAALLSLKDRSNSAIRQAALKLLGERGVEVRTAALAALVRSATAGDVPTLAALLAGAEDPQVRQAAFETLRLMPTAGVNQALIGWMAENPSELLVRCAWPGARRSSCRRFSRRRRLPPRRFGSRR